MVASEVQIYLSLITTFDARASYCHRYGALLAQADSAIKEMAGGSQGPLF